jgi:hypothetical protein
MHSYYYSTYKHSPGDSFFMAIGTTIRTDSSPIATEAFNRINRRPMVLPRQYQNLRDEKN